MQNICRCPSSAMQPTVLPALKDGRYLSKVSGGITTSQQQIDDDAVVVDPQSYASVYGLLRCMVPASLLQSVLDDLKVAL